MPQGQMRNPLLFRGTNAVGISCLGYQVFSKPESTLTTFTPISSTA